ncbi:MAG TPA: peptidase M20, partial [Ramlibacter sp.]|nr:peptidase M20 [Ramlibacter sp.]
ELGLDMRSNSAEELKKLEERMLALAREAAAEENARWGQRDVIKVDLKLVGDRPAGGSSLDAPMLHAARRAITAVGAEVKSIIASSTDSNLPISLGIPALTLGSGGIGGGSHGPGEWYSPVNAWLGPQSQFLTIVSLVGLDGVTQPLLAKR